MDTKEQKVYFAQKYGLAERDITVEFLPLLIAFDGMSVQNQKLGEQNQELLEKVSKAVNPVTNEHYYDGMTAGSAFFLRWGWGVWVFGLGIIFAGAWLVIDKNHLDLEKDRVELAKMQRVLLTDSTGAYRISSDHYKIISPNKRSKFKGIELVFPQDK